MTQRSSNFAAPTSSRDLRKVNQSLPALPAAMPDATPRGLFTCAHVQEDMPKPTLINQALLGTKLVYTIYDLNDCKWTRAPESREIFFFFFYI